MIKRELGSVCSRLSSGKSIRAENINPIGVYPVIGGNGLRGYTDSYNFDGECAVIGRQGAACGNVRYHSGKAYMTEHAVVVCANDDNDTRYLSYLLSIQNLGRLSAQSAQPGISVKTLSKQEVCLPPLDEQKRVSQLLGTIDSKINANTKLNDYLFECCAAKMNDIVGVPSSTIKVDDCCELIYSGGTPSTKNPAYWNGDLPWLSSGETRSRFIIDTEKTITELGVMESSTKLAKTGDIVMASAGQGFTRGQTSMLFFDTYVNQSVVVMRPKKDYGAYLLLMLAGQYDNLRAWSDSTSTRGSMSGKLLKQFELPYFDANQAKELTEFAAPMFRMIENNMRESKVLAQARDVLLPKLMSGEIDLAKIEFPTQPNNHLRDH